MKHSLNITIHYIKMPSLVEITIEGIFIGLERTLNMAEGKSSNASNL
ncbi:hypothetical protein JCM17380_43410 [Desulfosporosinus burensis]